MRIACWVPKATDTHSEYVIPIPFSLQQWLHERPSMLHFTYIACFFFSSHPRLSSQWSPSFGFSISSLMLGASNLPRFDHAGEEHKIRVSQYVIFSTLQSPVKSFSLGAHILLITLFSHTLILLLTDTCLTDLDTSSHNTKYSWIMREGAF